MNHKVILFIISLSALLLFSCKGRSPGSNTQADNLFEEEMISPRGETNAEQSGRMFTYPELFVSRSPGEKHEFVLSAGERVVDFTLSQLEPVVFILYEESGGHRNGIISWHIGKEGQEFSYPLPDNFKGSRIVKHPREEALFVMGTVGNKYEIIRIEQKSSRWQHTTIFSSESALKNLIITPRPYIMTERMISGSYRERRVFRLYMGMENKEGGYRIVTVTEEGERPYQVVGPEATMTTAENMDADVNPSDISAGYALPVAFHPAGHQLIWEDEQHNHYVATYWGESWGGYSPLESDMDSIGVLVPIPNGLGFIHYRHDRNGVGVYLRPTGEEKMEFTESKFESAPLPLADGKGIVGVTLWEGQYVINYLPVDIPLADVVNAWMFVFSQEEMSLFGNNYGLFRSNNGNQLYKLYETENYYKYSDLARPYLVTTDIMWEIFGSAYQGVFILNEKENAIPNFWEFVNATRVWLRDNKPESIWIPVFKTLADIVSVNEANPEVIRILNEENSYCELIDNEYAYSDLKPRGHYTSSPEMESYFRAFRYFTTIYLNKQNILKELNEIPEEIKIYAKRWIDSYSWMIAPSRATLVWEDIKNEIPAYCRYPADKFYLFPLSWGVDNEILHATVFHEDFPPDVQIISATKERRVFPLGLDLAAVLGSNFANQLLRSDYEKYPNLQKVINRLKNNFKENYGASDNIYNQWMDALAVQWTDGFDTPNGAKDRNIWQTKRLQTGLASWATLRHATILVNERLAAEAGEAGFETLVMREPRGTVEPDPNSFAAIAGLFDSMAKYVTDIRKKNPDSANRSVYDGVIERLSGVAADVRGFEEMAKRVKQGEPLNAVDFDKIMNVARVAEHYFLLFNSLSNDEYGMSDPDPIAKIADVMRDEKYPPYATWMVAVGNAMEWDHIVPFYGRRQIVKGSIYSYYEIVSEQILNDEQWREQVEQQEPLPWIRKYITQKEAGYLGYKVGY